MKIDKEFIVKNIITICCVVSIILLFLPFGKMSADIYYVDFEYMEEVSDNTSVTFSGFDAIFGKEPIAVAWGMLISPVLLIAMNYIKQLNKYKSILAIVLPVVSLLSSIITLSAAVEVSSESVMGASMDVKILPQAGFILLLFTYAGTLLAGVVNFYGLKLNKEGIAEFGNKLKEEGLTVMNYVNEEAEKTEEPEMISEIIKPEPPKTEVREESKKIDVVTVKSIKKINLNQADEVLALIR